MSKKQKHKKIAKSCLVCGKELFDKKEKIAFRVDKTKGHKEHNIIIICEDCHRIFNNETIYDIYIDIRNIETYFKEFGKTYLNMFYQKIYRLRMKNKKG